MGRREIPEINAGSMADIAFLLLIFFLVTTTMDTDKGLIRKLPPVVDDIPEEIKQKQRNIFEILVNANDQLLVEVYLQIFRKSLYPQMSWFVAWHNLWILSTYHTHHQKQNVLV